MASEATSLLRLRLMQTWAHKAATLEPPLDYYPKWVQDASSFAHW